MAVRGNMQATVSWTAPASNGGSPITQYIATATPGGQAATTTGATSVVVTGLTNGTSYTFTVRAVNVIAAGPNSAASNSVIPATVPTPPTGVSAVRGNQSATVSWVAPSNNGGLPITGYTVTSSPGGVMATTTGALGVVVNGLTNGQSYTFTVVATNGVGPSAPSTASLSVTPATLPGIPGTPSAVRGNQQVTLTWTPAASNGASISQYTIVSNPATLPVTAFSTNAIVTGLTNGTTYTFTVSAINALGPGPMSMPSNPVVPGVNLRAIASDSSPSVSPAL
jgi:predicted phage tail protein